MIKADFVHLAIRGFNFINIIMIIFSLGKFLLWARTFQILRVVGAKYGQKWLSEHIFPFFVSLTSCI